LWFPITNFLIRKKHTKGNLLIVESFLAKMEKKLAAFATWTARTRKRIEFSEGNAHCEGHTGSDIYLASPLLASRTYLGKFKSLRATVNPEGEDGPTPSQTEKAFRGTI
jgi:hypothetical protein